MGTSLFVSDVHLCQDRPHTTAAFLAFLQDQALAADNLYILGDLFEYWVGDDDLADPFAAGIADALAVLAARVPVFLLHGNRDFLLASGFARQARLTLLPDPTLVTVQGRPTLLLHGDTLCTDDLAYQEFRATVRADDWQQHFLGQPLTQRRAYAAGLRRQSETAKSGKGEAIMDINEAALAALLRAWDYPVVIHGHTHRPASHRFTLDGRKCQRHVLPDWYGRGGYLICDAGGCRLHQL